jgi:predicted nucleotidyltransferase
VAAGSAASVAVEASVVAVQAAAGEEAMGKTNAQEQARSSADALHRVLGERLIAVLLYGSAARGEFLDRRSDLNLLVLLDRIDPPLLQRMAPAAKEWTTKRVNAMLLEHRDWLHASDAFAVELMDMTDARVVLTGEDPLAGIHIDSSAARLQAERELRGRIIGLHNGLVLCGEDPVQLGHLLMAALPSFVTFLRAALRLAGHAVPSDTRSVIVKGAELVGAPAAGFLASMEARLRNGDWSVRITDDVVEHYNAAAERTARFVDSLGGGEG